MRRLIAATPNDVRAANAWNSPGDGLAALELAAPAALDDNPRLESFDDDFDTDDFDEDDFDDDFDDDFEEWQDDDLDGLDDDFFDGADDIDADAFDEDLDEDGDEEEELPLKADDAEE